MGKKEARKKAGKAVAKPAAAAAAKPHGEVVRGCHGDESKFEFFSPADSRDSGFFLLFFLSLSLRRR
jgi:hypothetical protein